MGLIGAGDGGAATVALSVAEIWVAEGGVASKVEGSALAAAASAASANDVDQLSAEPPSAVLGSDAMTGTKLDGGDTRKSSPVKEDGGSELR